MRLNFFRSTLTLENKHLKRGVESKPKTTTFHTIGYEQTDPHDFLQRLHQHGVSMIVDVRAVALSRKKGFSKNQLQDLLSQNDIGYLHVQTLGAPKEIRDELRETGSWWNYVKGYAKVLAERQEDIQMLVDLAVKERICLLCFERNPSECHRSLVAAEMEKCGLRPLQTEHIRY